MNPSGRDTGLEAIRNVPETGEATIMVKVMGAILWCPWIVFLITGFYLVFCSAFNMAFYHPGWLDLVPYLERHRKMEECFIKNLLKAFVPLALVTIYVIAGMR